MINLSFVAGILTGFVIYTLIIAGVIYYKEVLAAAKWVGGRLRWLVNIIVGLICRISDLIKSRREKTPEYWFGFDEGEELDYDALDEDYVLEVDPKVVDEDMKFIDEIVEFCEQNKEKNNAV